MTVDAFPKVTIGTLEGDVDHLFSNPLADLDRMAAVYRMAHEAEEDFPGFIRDEISVNGAHICACIDHGAWLAVNEPVEPNWDHPSLRDHHPR